MANRMKTVRYSLGTSKHLSFNIGKCWNVTGGGVTWTDATTNINSTAASDVVLGTAVNDAIYYGSSTPFDALATDMTTSSAGGTRVAEYWNGSTWATLTTAGASLTTLADNNMVYWTAPTDWATTTVNSEGDGPWYYVRVRVSVLATTGGTFTGVNLAQMQMHQATVNIPETSSRTIRKAWVQLNYGGSLLAITEQLHITSRWGSTAFADPVTRWVTTNNFTTSGESWAYEVYVDVTAQTVTQWSSGTDATFDLALSIAMRGIAGNGCRAWSSAELFITYEHDETAATQLNTVVLPIDSLTGSVAATTTTIQVNGIPILTGGSGLIKEASPVIKDMYIVFEANVDEGGTTDYTFYGQVGSESEVELATFDAANQSDFFTRLIWRRTDLVTTSAYDLKCRVSSTAGATFPHVGAYLVVTYTYDDTTTTTVTHTDVTPFCLSLGVLGGTTAADQSVQNIEFWIEGESPVLLQSGIQLLSYQSADPGNLLLAAGSQTPRSYTVPPTVASGPVAIAQRIDSGGAAGLGLTLARGKCTLTISARRDGSNTSAWGAYGVAYITYAYTRNATKRHSTVGYPIAMFSTLAATTRIAGSVQLQIPDANWFISSVGVSAREILTGGQYIAATLTIKKSDNNGFLYLGGYQRAPANYIAPMMRSCVISNFIKRYAADPRAMGVLELVSASRTCFLENPNGSRMGSAVLWANFHNFDFTVSGSITFSDGGTVNLALIDATTHEIYNTGSRVGNGSYSFSHFDSARLVYVAAHEDSTHQGRSDNGNAS